MNKNNLKGSLILTLAALIWGLAFVAQSKAANVPPFLLNCLRSAITVPLLYIVYKFTSRKTREPLIPKDPEKRKKSLIAGAVCGIFLSIAANFQQFGIAAYPKGAPSEAHAGFITATYVIIVPLMSILIYKKFSAIVTFSALMAMGGFYLLCLKGGMGKIYGADLLVLACAFAFSLQIIFIDKYVSAVGGIRLSLFQFAVVTVISGIMSLIFERGSISFAVISDNLSSILYLGVMSSTVAYTLQIIGQKYAEASVASIAMSLESVFAAIGGWIISGNALNITEIFGCLTVFAAIVLAQTPEFIKRKS